jgi:16S rRNA G966 N2-methylase RsmD
MQALMSGHWLRPEGLLLLECATNVTPQVMPGWQLLQERRYGSTTILVLNRP